MAKKQRRGPPKWSIWPTKHAEVQELLQAEGISFKFNPNDVDIDTDDGQSKEYDTKIMGRFVCHNQNCATSGWASKHICITIRMYPGRQYNARVYHQHCKRCNGISAPILDDSYAERVAYRLKVWSGLQMVKPPFTSKKSNGPHEEELCEGCQAGHCMKGQNKDKNKEVRHIVPILDLKLPVLKLRLNIASDISTVRTLL
ncbi:zinc-binding domain-containing protein [Xylaria sp. CBS 124048]|nr:zinc-binding domain-containing protein [Xylaria sp. CBS 124048]